MYLCSSLLFVLLPVLPASAAALPLKREVGGGGGTTSQAIATTASS